MNYFHITRKKFYSFGPLGETGKGCRLLSPDKIWGTLLTMLNNFPSSLYLLFMDNPNPHQMLNKFGTYSILY